MLHHQASHSRGRGYIKGERRRKQHRELWHQCGWSSGRGTVVSEQYQRQLEQGQHPGREQESCALRLLQEVQGAEALEGPSLPRL